MIAYSITEVAKLLGVPVHKIRYWEKKIPLLSVQRNMYGKRLYYKQDIYLLYRFRFYMTENKNTIRGAGEKLMQEMSQGVENIHRLEFLSVMKGLEHQNKRLKAARDILEDLKGE